VERSSSLWAALPWASGPSHNPPKRIQLLHSFHLLSQFDHSFFILKWKAKETIQQTNSTPTLISLIIKEIELGGLVAAVFSPREVKPFALFVAVFSSLRSSAAVPPLTHKKERQPKQTHSFPWGSQALQSLINSQFLFSFSKRKEMELI